MISEVISMGEAVPLYLSPTTHCRIRAHYWGSSRWPQVAYPCEFPGGYSNSTTLLISLLSQRDALPYCPAYTPNPKFISKFNSPCWVEVALPFMRMES